MQVNHKHAHERESKNTQSRTSNINRYMYMYLKLLLLTLITIIIVIRKQRRIRTLRQLGKQIPNRICLRTKQNDEMGLWQMNYIHQYSFHV